MKTKRQQGMKTKAKEEKLIKNNRKSKMQEVC